MKNVINRIIIMCLFTLVSSSLFAEKNYQLLRPTGRNTVIVGKLILKNEIDREFYSKTIGNIQIENNLHTYDLPLYINLDEAKSRKNKTMTTRFTIGDNFIVTYPYDRNRKIELHRVRIRYLDSASLCYDVPLMIEVTIPKNAEYVYIGTFICEIVGDDFTLKSVTRIDEYDEAQEELNTILGKTVTLIRVPVNEIENSDD